MGGHRNLPAGGQQTPPTHCHLVTQGAGGEGYDSRAGAALERHFGYALGRLLVRIIGTLRATSGERYPRHFCNSCQGGSGRTFWHALAVKGWHPSRRSVRPACVRRARTTATSPSSGPDTATMSTTAPSGGCARSSALGPTTLSVAGSGTCSPTDRRRSAHYQTRCPRPLGRIRQGVSIRSR